MTRSGRDLLVCVTLGIAIFAAFGGAVHHGFLAYDDKSVLVENPRLVQPSWSNAIALFGEVRDEAYLPLWYLAYFPELVLFTGSGAAAGQSAALGADRACAVHIASLCWHLLAAWLVFLLAEQMLQSRAAALIAALLFALHPLQAESVAWASGRKDQVSLVLLLLALLACVRCWRVPRGLPWAAAVLVFVGSFAKGSMVVAPALAALTWMALRAQGSIAAQRKLRGSLLLLTIAAALPAALHMSIAVHQGTAGGTHEFLERCHLGATALLRYGSHALLPYDLSIHAAEPQFSEWASIAALALCLLLAVAWWLRHSRPSLVLALMLWFPAALAPFNNVFPATSLWYADRYASMALPGACMLLAWACLRLPRWLAASLAVAALGALLFLSRARTAEFRDDATLFGAAMLLEPKDAMIPAHLAEGLLGAESSAAQREQGMALLRQSLALAENSGKAVLALRAHVRLGDVLLASGRAGEALPHHAAALAIVNQHSKRVSALGLNLTVLRANHAAGLIATGELAAAREAIATALRTHPSPELKLLQGRLLLRDGLQAVATNTDADAVAQARKRVEEALLLLREAAASADPAQAALALRERGEALLVAPWVAGRYAEARLMVEELLARFPTRSDGLLLSSRLREEGGDLPGSLQDLLKALELDVREIPLFARAAALLQRAGENRKAVEILRAGLRVDPNSPLLRTELGSLLLAQSRRHLGASAADMALRAAEEALRLLPDVCETHVAMGDAFAALGRWEAAEGAWQAALDINANDRDAQRGMARFLQARGLGTLADLQRALRSVPEAERVQREQELRDRVRADFRRALELGGDWDELSLSRRHIAEVTERERRTTGLELQQRAQASLAAGRIAEAQALARSALKVDGASAAGNFLLARIELAAEDPSAALVALQATLAIDPKHLAANAAAAQLYFVKGNADEARRCAERFLRVAEEHPDAGLEEDVTRLKKLLERLGH